MIGLLAVPGPAQRGGVRGGPGRNVTPPPPPPTVSTFENLQPAKYGGKTDTRPLKFTSSVQAVLVPAVVLDKSGRHVAGLGKDDFTLLENGKEQKIASVEEVTPQAQPVSRPTLGPNQFSNVTLGNEAPKQLTILVLDTVNTPFLDQARAREALIRYLVRTVNAGQPTMLATISTKGVKVIHDFTSDPGVLVAALQKVHSQLPQLAGSNTAVADAPSVDVRTFAGNAMNAEVDQLMSFLGSQDLSPSYQQGAAVGTTLEAMLYLAESLTAIPGRKSLVWITGSFPFNIDTDTASILGGDSPATLYERTFQALNNANIAVYPVDARGLVGGGLPDASVRSTSANVQAPTAFIANTMQAQADTIGTLDMVASMTGGVAFFNRNDLENAFREAAADSSAYYMLSYYLDKSNTKPGWRKLTVKVHREGTKVRARAGFFLDRTLMDPQETREMDLAVALQSPLDYSGLPFYVRLTKIDGKGDDRKVSFSIILPPNVAMIDADDGNRINLDFAAVARDGKGNGKAEFSQTFQSKLKPDGVTQIKESGITYNNVLQLPPGEYSVRFVVRDNLTGRMGSVLAPIKVM